MRLWFRPLGGRAASSYAMVGEHDVGPVNLVVEVGQGPVQHGGKQVFQDVLRDLLRGFAEPLLLLEPLFTLLREARPRARDPFDAGTVRGQFF